MTRYTVLAQVTREGAKGDPTTGDQVATEEVVPGTFVVVGEVDAQTDVAAIKAVAKDRVDLSNGAVAVPTRSWRIRKPQRKVEERTLWT